MTLEELETLEKYNRDKASLDKNMQGKLDSLDNFRKNISTDNGVVIYFTVEAECNKRRSYDNICNPVYSMIRTVDMRIYDKHEELGKRARVRARKLIDLIIEKCKEEHEQKLANLEVELKSNLEKEGIIDDYEKQTVRLKKQISEYEFEIENFNKLYNKCREQIISEIEKK